MHVVEKINILATTVPSIAVDIPKLRQNFLNNVIGGGNSICKVMKAKNMYGHAPMKVSNKIK